MLQFTQAHLRRQIREVVEPTVHQTQLLLTPARTFIQNHRSQDEDFCFGFNDNSCSYQFRSSLTLSGCFALFLLFFSHEDVLILEKGVM